MYVYIDICNMRYIIVISYWNQLKSTLWAWVKGQQCDRNTAEFGSLTKMNSTWTYLVLTCASTVTLETICIQIRPIEHFYNCTVFNVLLHFTHHYCRLINLSKSECMKLYCASSFSMVGPKG